MTDGDCCTTKLDELDRLLNDPDLPLQSDLIWSLLDEVIRAGCYGRGRVVPDVAIQIPAGEMVAQHPRPQKTAKNIGPPMCDEFLVRIDIAAA